MKMLRLTRPPQSAQRQKRFPPHLGHGSVCTLQAIQDENRPGLMHSILDTPSTHQCMSRHQPSVQQMGQHPMPWTLLLAHNKFCRYVAHASTNYQAHSHRALSSKMQRMRCTPLCIPAHCALALAHVATLYAIATTISAAPREAHHCQDGLLVSFTNQPEDGGYD